MSSFKHVVKNYENLAKLGRQIIQHKKDVKNIKSDNLEKAFFIQEQKIQQFFDDATDTHQYWIKNSNSINEFWTGHS
tara:strand:+ start:1110 stop:1340 length:231 start_codon:yes stop_codon:yes gene_type:complete